MEFNNLNTTLQKCDVIDVEVTQSIDPNISSKKYSICSYCKCYQPINQLQAYICNGCKKQVNRLSIYHLFQCQGCNSYILHQDGSIVICSQCKMVVGLSQLQMKQQITN